MVQELGDWLIPRTTEAVTGARHRVRSLVSRVGGYDSLIDDIVLLAGELIANSARHGAGAETRIRVLDVGSAVRVEVSDAYTGLLGEPEESLLGEAGRGLMIVEATAADSGIDQDADGTTAWFVMRADQDLVATRPPGPRPAPESADGSAPPIAKRNVTIR